MNDTFSTDKNHFFLSGQAGQLEVLTTRPKNEQKPVVGIICHPDPRFQGTMNNKVVTTIARAFEDLGFATVRFNFRGVGKSAGTFGETIGETADLLTIIDWVKRVLPDYQIYLAGFSFGSYIAANVANQITVKQLISIAPPVHHYNFNQLTNIHCPWLVVQGDQDEVVPFAEVKSFAENPPAPLKFIVMPRVGHFFHGRLLELQKILMQEY